MINKKMFEYIKSIEENRSFSKAAQELYIAQPSLSRYVKSLEIQLGVELFDRKKIPLELTEAGESFLKYICKFEDLERELMNEFLEINSGNIKHLAVGTLTYLGQYILPQIINSFTTNYPNTKLDIKEYTGKKIENALINGDIDLYLTNLPPKNKNISYKTIITDRLLLVGLKTPLIESQYDLTNNSLNNPLPIDLSTFENEQFILLQPWQNMRMMAEEVFKAHQFKANKILETSSVASALNLVNCDRGLTFICESAINHANIDFPIIYFSLGEIENIGSVIISYIKNNGVDIIKDFCNCAYDVFNKTP